MKLSSFCIKGLVCQTLGFPSGLVVKNPPANAEDMGSIPGSGRSPGGGNDNPLWYFLPEQFHRGAWWAEVHGITKSQR